MVTLKDSQLAGPLAMFAAMTFALLSLGAYGALVDYSLGLGVGGAVAFGLPTAFFLGVALRHMARDMEGAFVLPSLSDTALDKKGPSTPKE